MIHQHIFASPKPGMTEESFQDYWVNVHAVKYASKIKQIKKYLIDTRIDAPGQADPPMWSGIAEIWIENEKEQLESLQSPEFLQGARLDEPNWAAFWNTQVLDTDAHVVMDGPVLDEASGRVKVISLVRRKEGMQRDDFRSYLLEKHARVLKGLPGLVRCLCCTTRNSWYAVGEPRFDAIVQLWFENAAGWETAMQSGAFGDMTTDQGEFLERKYIFSMVCKEHWIIGPDPR